MVLISRTDTIRGNDLVNSSNTVTGFVYKKQNQLSSYFQLRTVNDSLLKENERLQNIIAEKNYSNFIIKDSNATVSSVITEDSSHKVRYAHYIYRNAKVINNSIEKENNYITIGRGGNDGIKVGMAVISGTGIVGKIVHVSAHFATALSILSEIQPVSAKLKDGTTGIVKWGYEKRLKTYDALYMDDVSKDLQIHIGDSIFTTNYSFFPPDVLVGTISAVQIVKKTNKRLLTIKPATNFRNTQYVYVVENTMNEERTALEAAAEKDIPKKATTR